MNKGQIIIISNVANAPPGFAQLWPQGPDKLIPHRYVLERNALKEAKQIQMKTEEYFNDTVDVFLIKDYPYKGLVFISRRHHKLCA
jgi:hypothetical protein